MFLLAPILTLFAFLTYSEGKIWEGGAKPLLNYNLRFQRVQSEKKTATKFAKYFLIQREVNNWKVGKNPSPRLKRQARRESHPYDVLFMIDSSNSIRQRDFLKGVEALKTLIPKTRPDTSYASISFSYKAKVDFFFSNAEDAKRKLRTVRHAAGKTNTQAALELARVNVFNVSAHSGVRVNSFKRALILTDGQSNVKKEKTLYNAFRLKEAGIEIFVIAVGKYLSGISEIVGLASSTDAHLYRVKNLNSFYEIVKLIPSWRSLRQQQHKTWLSSMSRDEQGY